MILRERLLREAMDHMLLALDPTHNAMVEIGLANALLSLVHHCSRMERIRRDALSWREEWIDEHEVIHDYIARIETVAT